MRIGKRKLIALVLIAVIIVSVFLIFPMFIFQPSIKSVKVLGIKQLGDNLVIDASLVIINNFQAISINKGHINILYENNKFATITINNPLDINSGENSIKLSAFVDKEDIKYFSIVLNGLFSKGNIEVSYEGNVNTKFLFFEIPTTIKGSTFLYQYSLNNTIKSVSIDKNTINVIIENPLNSSFIIQDISGVLKIYNNDIIHFYSNKSYEVEANQNFIINLFYNSTSYINNLGNIIFSNPLMNSIINAKIKFGTILIPLNISLSRNIEIPAFSNFTINSIKYFKYPERLEITGYLSSKIASLPLNGINLAGGSGKVILNETYIADFRITDSSASNGIVYSKIVILPIIDNFYLFVDEFLKNSTVKLSLNFVEQPKLAFGTNIVNLKLGKYSINLDWGYARFIIGVKPYSIMYDQNKDTLIIGFNFSFLSLNVTGIPMTIDEAVFKLNFNNGKLVFDQKINGPIDLSNSSNFFTTVTLGVNDPNVKPLIQDFAKNGSLLLQIQGGYLKVNVYGKTISKQTNLNILLKISPLDILEANAYLINIRSFDSSYKLDLNISLKSKLKVEKFFLVNVYMNVFTIEGDKVLENFKQDINQYISNEQSYNFSTTSVVKLSKSLTGKMIKDFLEKGKTNLIILDANITVKIGTFSIILLIRNVTLNVILLPLLQVYLNNINIINGKTLSFSFDMKLKGIEVPFGVNNFEGNVTDEFSNIIGYIKLSNASYINSSFKGNGLMVLTNKNQTNLAKILLGYNATVIGKNIKGSISLLGENYDLFAESSVFITIIPNIKPLSFEVSVIDINVPPSISDNFVYVKFRLTISNNIVDAKLVNASFTIKDELRIEVANGTISEVIPISKDTYIATAKLNLLSGPRLDYIATLIANGKTVKVTIDKIIVIVNLMDQYYTASLPLNLTITYQSKPVQVEILEFQVTYISGNEIKAKSTIKIINPYNFTVKLDLAILNIYDSMDGKPVGNTQLSNITLGPNSSTIISDLEINIPDVSVSYVLRHYNSQNDTLKMNVDIQVLISIKVGNLKTIIQYTVDNLPVRYR
jgi:hypothetical protein